MHSHIITLIALYKHLIAAFSDHASNIYAAFDQLFSPKRHTHTRIRVQSHKDDVLSCRNTQVNDTYISLRVTNLPHTRPFCSDNRLGYQRHAHYLPSDSISSLSKWSLELSIQNSI